MKYIHTRIDNTIVDKDSFPSEKCCFFDIETTGLSPQVSSVYLIGATCISVDGIELHQWFADDYRSEQLLLEEFSSFTQKYSTIIHFNGNRFDIPYLENKYEKYKLASPFARLNSTDIYFAAKKYKQFLSLPNCKLQTVEEKLGFSRRDQFSGKDCIQLYMDFMKKKVFYDDSCMSAMDKLLLHNSDDLLGTMICSRLLSYESPQWKDLKIIQADSHIELCAKSPVEFPMQEQFDINELQFSIEQSNVTITIPIVTATLYHYFPDYKNYYYLPDEDMAIHKSVATFVEASKRKKTTKETCYIKKEGQFIPLPSDVHPVELSLFKQGLKDPIHFLLLDKDYSYIENNIAMLFQAYWNMI